MLELGIYVFISLLSIEIFKMKTLYPTIESLIAIKQFPRIANIFMDLYVNCKM